nr:branched-chain amino acid ABC transporter permease [uncultured Gellertiella sp.]
MTIATILINGILLGGLYCLFALGLSLAFGIMRLVNLAHGEFIVLAAYLAHVATTLFGLSAASAIPLVLCTMSLAGYVLQRVLFNRVLGGDPMQPLLITFGLSIVIQNGLVQGFSANPQRLQAGALDIASVSIGPLSIGLLPLAIFAIALAATGLLHLVFYHSRLGLALRAASDDPETLDSVGASHDHMFGLASALSFLVIAVGGILMGTRGNFDPFSGSTHLLLAFETVIIGGLGSLWGTLAGGIILGLAQSLGASIDPGYQMIAGHLAFLTVLVARPSGLFSRGT